jgi:hypothetical protein
MNYPSSLRWHLPAAIAGTTVALAVFASLVGTAVPRAHADATTTATSTEATSTGMLTGTVVTATSTATTTDMQGLINALQGLGTTYPTFSSLIQTWIMQLMNMGTTTSTTTPMANPTGAHVDQDGWNVWAGGVMDFGGRNFGHEEQVHVMLNGQTIATAHADGGGNFSTGSIRLPSTPGDYMYMFHGLTSGDMLSATLHVH